MATITYIHQTKKPEAQIFCRVSIQAGTTFKRRTGFTCNSEQLKLLNSDNKRGFKDARLKALYDNLSELRNHLHDRINEELARGMSLNGQWLAEELDRYYGRNQEETEELPNDLISYAEHFVEQLPYKLQKDGSIGVAEATRKKYVSTLHKLKDYCSARKRKLSIAGVNEAFRVDFNRFLKEEQGLAPNTIGKYVKIVKTIALDAQSNGIEVSPQLNKVRGQSEASDKTYLSFEELEQIKNCSYQQEAHRITRDWLLIGCYTGQRVSDLLRMNRSMIMNSKGFDFISLEQTKTGKKVMIPIHPEVRAILDSRKGEFPPSFGSTAGSASALFNRYIKEVCLKAGINELEEGMLHNPETKRGEKGQFKKWKLLSSHACRRSFATNFYATEEYPTPLLMNITAHSTEKQFLEYIGKKPLDYSLKLAEIWSR